jgi:hypothetical protein
VVAGLAVAAASVHPGGATAQEAPEGARDSLTTAAELGGPYLLYRPGIRFGSEATGGPLNVVLNRGLSVMHFRGVERSLADTDWGKGWDNVLDALVHPGEAVRRSGGWKSWVAREFFPTDLKVWSWAWAPNYAGHIVAGGLTQRYLEEWLHAHGAPFPAVTAATMLMGTMVLNEIIENQGNDAGSGGTVADLYIFDPLGIVLFRIDGIARFFSETLRAADWSPQASLTVPRGRVANVSQSIAYKVPLPFSERLRVLLYVGQGSQTGLTWELGDGLSIGGTLGFDGNVRIIDPVTLEERIEPKPTGSLFLDRDDSLLASLVISRDAQSAVMANLYPGVLPGFFAEVGLWLAVSHDRQVAFGIGTRRTLGLGFGVDTTSR